MSDEVPQGPPTIAINFPVPAARTSQSGVSQVQVVQVSKPRFYLYNPNPAG